MSQDGRWEAWDRDQESKIERAEKARKTLRDLLLDALRGDELAVQHQVLILSKWDAMEEFARKVFDR